MGKIIRIKKGLDIRLVGEADKSINALPLPETFAVCPPDFPYVVPKLLVKEGDEVLAGTPLFYDKGYEAVKFCSPVSGEVVEILRGEKRKILHIKILADKEIKFAEAQPLQPGSLPKEEIIQKMLDGGLWPFIRQRPFGTIANPADLPKAIFISGFDSNPLAPDLDFIMQDVGDDFQAGLDVLKKLINGNIHLNIKEGSSGNPAFKNAQGVEINQVSGPHPAGNVGVQIHHINPVNKGEVVWCVNPQDVLVIGRFFSKGKYDVSKMISVAGSQVERPAYYKTISGASVKHILEHAGLKAGNNRVISGNLLTGKKIDKEGYLGFYHQQVTVIPEGDKPEFMGWLSMGLNKLSMSRAFLSRLLPSKKHEPTTNMHGEERAFVMSGQYEKVFPMDILPVHLLKSILIEDVEMMEKLGIYEVVDEDFALCEFVCTSKIESQQIIRDGIALLKKELG